MPVFTFGDTRFIDPGITGISLVSTVIFLALCDYATHCMEEFLGHSTIYMSMLQKIYKELMIMGLVSFGLVMYEAAHPNSSNEVHLWINTFDYVGYVLFFNAIYTVIHALSIIIWSIRTSAEYNRFHSTSITDVSLGIEKLKQNWFLQKVYQLNYYPFLSARQIAEFKVIHVLFRNTFGVPIDFNFGDYLGKCFERYSLNIINLSVISWIVMFVLYGINMIRIYAPYPNDSFKCEENNDDHSTNGGSGHRILLDTISNVMWNILSNDIDKVDSVDNNIDMNGDDHHNNNDNDGNNDHNNNDDGNNEEHTDDTIHDNKSLNNCDLSYVRLFTMCSAILEFYVILVFMMGRVYTLRLLRKAGIEDVSDKEDDLVYFLDEEAAREHNFLHGDDIEKQTPANTSESSANMPSSTRATQRRMSINTFASLIEKAKVAQKSLKKSNFGLSPIQESGKITESPLPLKPLSNQDSPVIMRKKSRRPSKFHLVSNYAPITSSASLLSQEENIFTITRKIEAQRKKSMEFRNRGEPELKLAEDFSDIYTFQSPTLYFRAVELGIVLNCIYLSLWVGDFIFIANQLGDSSAFYQLLMAIPCVFLIPLLTQTVKTASLLAAIAALDVDVIAEVLEESEERTHLIQELRNKIIQRTASRGLQQRELLESVFKEIDADGSGEINQSELKSVLIKLDMGYSGKKFNRLYTAIDRNGDGTLSIAELNHLLFPQDAQQKEVEELGAKVQSRIDRRITALETEQRSESSNITLKTHQKRLEQISSLKTLSESTRTNNSNLFELHHPPITSEKNSKQNLSSNTNLKENVSNQSSSPSGSIQQIETSGEKNILSSETHSNNTNNNDNNNNTSNNNKNNIIQNSNIESNLKSPKNNESLPISQINQSDTTDSKTSLAPRYNPIPSENFVSHSNSNRMRLPSLKYSTRISRHQHRSMESYFSSSGEYYNSFDSPIRRKRIPYNYDSSRPLMERVRRHLRESKGYSPCRIEPTNINTNNPNDNNDWEYTKNDNNNNNNNSNSNCVISSDKNSSDQHLPTLQSQSKHYNLNRNLDYNNSNNHNSNNYHKQQQQQQCLNYQDKTDDIYGDEESNGIHYHDNNNNNISKNNNNNNNSNKTKYNHTPHHFDPNYAHHHLYHDPTHNNNNPNRRRLESWELDYDSGEYYQDLVRNRREMMQGYDEDFEYNKTTYNNIDNINFHPYVNNCNMNRYYDNGYDSEYDGYESNFGYNRSHTEPNYAHHPHYQQSPYEYRNHRGYNRNEDL